METVIKWAAMCGFEGHMVDKLKVLSFNMIQKLLIKQAVKTEFQNCASQWFKNNSQQPHETIHMIEAKLLAKTEEDLTLLETQEAKVAFFHCL